MISVIKLLKLDDDAVVWRDDAERRALTATAAALSSHGGPEKTEPFSLDTLNGSINRTFNSFVSGHSLTHECVCVCVCVCYHCITAMESLVLGYILFRRSQMVRDGIMIHHRHHSEERKIAQTLVKRAVDQANIPWAYYVLGLMLETTHPQQSRSLYQTAMEKGVKEAFRRVAEMDHSLELIQKAAEYGDAEAMFLLATEYSEEEGLQMVEEELQEEKQKMLLTRSSVLGCNRATQVLVMNMLMSGSHRSAMRWLRKWYRGSLQRYAAGIAFDRLLCRFLQTLVQRTANGAQYHHNNETDGHGDHTNLSEASRNDEKQFDEEHTVQRETVVCPFPQREYITHNAYERNLLHRFELQMSQLSNGELRYILALYHYVRNC